MSQLILEQVKALLRMQGAEDQIEPSDDLVLAGLDSIGFVRLVEFLETEFGVKIPPEQVTLERFGTVEAVAAYLAGLTAK